MRAWGLALIMVALLACPRPAIAGTTDSRVLDAVNALMSAAPKLDAKRVEELTSAKELFETVRYDGTAVHWHGTLFLRVTPGAKPKMVDVRKRFGAPTSVETTHTFHPPTTGCVYHYKRAWGEAQFVSSFADDLDSVELETETATKVRVAESGARQKQSEAEAAERLAQPVPKGLSAKHVWDVVAQVEKLGRKITLPQFEAIVKRKLVPEGGTALGAPSMVTAPDAPYVDEFSRIEWRGEKGERPILFMSLLDAVNVSARDAIIRFGKPTHRIRLYELSAGYEYDYERPWGVLELYFDLNEKHLRQINLNMIEQGARKK